MHRILAINPGSTSTKISIYEDEKEILTKSLRHEKETEKFSKVIDQLDFRKGLILDFLKEANFEPDDFSAIIGRGGLLHPVPGGTFRVNEDMLEDLASAKYGSHASNLGGILAHTLADGKIPAYIADPVVVDEKIPEARYSGWPEIERICISHPLNQKAVAKLWARNRGGRYQDFNFIVAHMGGGLSVGAHEKGRIIDVNNALDGDGPFSAERSGGLPMRGMMDLFYSGKYPQRKDLNDTLVGKAGLYAYLGTKDGVEIVKRIEVGDEKAIEVIKAQAYQVAKEIGSCAAVLKGDVDAIILTGGLAYNKYFTDWIGERVSFIAELAVYPGEVEMQALTLAALEALRGECEVIEYQK